MNYTSTRDRSVSVASAQAIAQGISRDAGLFVPASLTTLDRSRLERLIPMSYQERAVDILADYLTDFTEDEIRQSVAAAYGGGKFSDDRIAPVVRLSETRYMLELWHGPTCAFKDMALQLLPHLLTRSLAKTVPGKEAVILVATSGDTGKAALDGFRDVPGTRILVFYPEEGVSNIQKLQMLTQPGDNVGVCGVYGNFDDTQTAVKQIFTDPSMIRLLEEQNMMFSSANSINWGRLVPQIVYYVSAWCDMLKEGYIEPGESVNIAVPTGNFGNILAAYYAKQMGLPVARLICASNINNVLTDFIRTGVYDRRRAFHTTSSPSMDILISSNLERLLFALTEEDDRSVASMMQQLSKEGMYRVSEQVRQKLSEMFYGGFCDEQATASVIQKTFVENRYLCDTHTAVALAVYDEYVTKTNDGTKTIIASTANPYKFSGSILSALQIDLSGDDFEQLVRLSEQTGTAIPDQILSLKNMPVRFSGACHKEEMPSAVERLLNQK